MPQLRETHRYGKLTPMGKKRKARDASYKIRLHAEQLEEFRQHAEKEGYTSLAGWIVRTLTLAQEAEEKAREDRTRRGKPSG